MDRDWPSSDSEEDVGRAMAIEPQLEQPVRPERPSVLQFPGVFPGFPSFPVDSQACPRPLRPKRRTRAEPQPSLPNFNETFRRMNEAARQPAPAFNVNEARIPFLQPPHIIRSDNVRPQAPAQAPIPKPHFSRQPIRSLLSFDSRISGAGPLPSSSSNTAEERMDLDRPRVSWETSKPSPEHQRRRKNTRQQIKTEKAKVKSPPPAPNVFVMSWLQPEPPPNLPAAFQNQRDAPIPGYPSRSIWSPMALPAKDNGLFASHAPPEPSSAQRTGTDIWTRNQHTGDMSSRNQPTFPRMDQDWTRTMCTVVAEPKEELQERREETEETEACDKRQKKTRIRQSVHDSELPDGNYNNRKQPVIDSKTHFASATTDAPPPYEPRPVTPFVSGMTAAGPPPYESMSVMPGVSGSGTTVAPLQMDTDESISVDSPATGHPFRPWDIREHGIPPGASGLSKEELLERMYGPKINQAENEEGKPKRRSRVEGSVQSAKEYLLAARENDYKMFTSMQHISPSPPMLNPTVLSAPRYSWLASVATSQVPQMVMAPSSISESGTPQKDAVGNTFGTQCAGVSMAMESDHEVIDLSMQSNRDHSQKRHSDEDPPETLPRKMAKYYNPPP